LAKARRQALPEFFQHADPLPVRQIKVLGINRIVRVEIIISSLCDLRTVGSLKTALPLLQAAAFIGATLCGIKHLHGKEDRFAVI
jgi:hypothetical protein